MLTKIEDVFEVARLVYGSLSLPLLEVSSELSMVEEARDSKTEQVSFKKCTERKVYMLLSLEEMSVPVYPHGCYEVVRFFGLVAIPHPGCLEALCSVRSESCAADR